MTQTQTQTDKLSSALYTALRDYEEQTGGVFQLSGFVLGFLEDAAKRAALTPYQRVHLARIVRETASKIRNAEVPAS